MLNKVIKAFLGLLILPIRVRIFNPVKVFKGRKVAIVGPADSAFKQENGQIIDQYDYVIRLNKALVTWNADNEKFLGTKTDILFHNFHENMDSGGGGPIDWKSYHEFELKFLVQPRFDLIGWRLMFNYFKKYLNFSERIYVLPRAFYKGIIVKFKNYHPTRGFYALQSALSSPCKEVLITGFTFFKTPYAQGYRDNIRDMDANRIHILNQGLHDIDLEFTNFLVLLKDTKIEKIRVDKVLFGIIENDAPELLSKIELIT